MAVGRATALPTITLYNEAGEGASAYGPGGGVLDTNGLMYSDEGYYNPSIGRSVQRQFNLWGQSLSRYQTYREISQASHNLQPTVEGTFHAIGHGVKPANWVRYQADNVYSAITAYNVGERNLLKLYALGSGITRALSGGANLVGQLSMDARVTFFSHAPWYDRLPSTTRLGAAAVGTGDFVAMVYFPIKGAVIKARIARNNAWAAERFAYLDEYLGAGTAGGKSLSELITEHRAIRAGYAEAAAWQFEELRVLEDVRYSASIGSIDGEHIVRLDGVDSLALDKCDFSTLRRQAERLRDLGATREERRRLLSPSASNAITDPAVIGEIDRMRTPLENKRARNYFKNNKEYAQELWTRRSGRPWPETDGIRWRAEHNPPLKSGGHPLNVFPDEGPATGPHMVIGPDGLTDFQRWGAEGTIVREINRRRRLRGW